MSGSGATVVVVVIASMLRARREDIVTSRTSPRRSYALMEISTVNAGVRRSPLNFRPLGFTARMRIRLGQSLRWIVILAERQVSVMV